MDHRTSISIFVGAPVTPPRCEVARELVDLKPELIVGMTTPPWPRSSRKPRASRSCSRASSIRSAVASSPTWHDLVATSPESSISNSRWAESGSKHSSRSRPWSGVSLLHNPEAAPFTASFVRVIEGSAESFAVDSIAAPVRDAAQLERAVIDFAAKPGGGLIVLPDMFTVGHRELIIALAARYRLPAVYPLRAFALTGGLISDGGDPVDIFRRAASYVDRILKGAKPGDLPVQPPTKFELVINLKTAKALGLDVPPTLLARADEVIE